MEISFGDSNIYGNQQLLWVITMAIGDGNGQAMDDNNDCG